MPRPPVKATLRLAEAHETGVLRAQLKAHQKKPFQEELREHIGKAIDRIDPIEAAAVLAATYVIHETIISTEKLFIRISRSGKKIIEGAGGDFLSKLLGSAAGILPNFLNQEKSAPIDTTNGLTGIFGSNDFFVWLVSFVVAYIGLKMAGKIGSSILDITGVLGFLGL